MGEQDGGDDRPFDEKCRTEIGKILGVLDDERFPAFWDALVNHCLAIRRGIETTPNSFKNIAPYDATLTQRAQWLRANILNPIDKLKAAIAVENHPYFNHWESYGEVETPVEEEFLIELNKLEQRASNLASRLDGERTGNGPSGKLSHNDEMRHYVVYTAIEEVRDHFPEIKLVRGNWDKGVGTMTGAVPDYVRRIFRETTGQNETLNGQLQFVISAL